MQIHIFDVAHGFCAYVIADNGNTMLMDCGHNDQTSFHPADYLLQNRCTGIESFFVLNYDEDHLSGLPRLRQYVHRIPIQVLYRNPSVTADQLRRIKQQSGPLGPGMLALLQMIETFTPGVVNFPAFPSIEFRVFWNSYPGFTDTNNLSLTLFLHYPGLSIVFPGDLEKAGWRSLLGKADFTNHLARVNLFVASHHGRENGYLREVFDHCRPEVIIISDETKQYDTQETDYSIHASGIPNSARGGTRRVLTTRNDGMLVITASGRDYRITPSR